MDNEETKKRGCKIIDRFYLTAHLFIQRKGFSLQRKSWNSIEEKGKKNITDEGKYRSRQGHKEISR